VFLPLRFRTDGLIGLLIAEGLVGLFEVILDGMDGMILGVFAQTVSFLVEFANIETGVF
jgi:hypothetical protein